MFYVLTQFVRIETLDICRHFNDFTKFVISSSFKDACALRARKETVSKSY